MQIERNLRLYEFEIQSGAKQVLNSGAQIFKNYTFKNKSLRASDKNLREQIRLNANGDLVGRVEQIDPKTKKSVILAYSNCTRKATTQAKLD